MRDDFLGALIDFYISKKLFQEKMLTISGKYEHKIKKEVYEDIIEDLVSTLKAYKKADADSHFLPEASAQPNMES